MTKRLSDLPPTKDLPQNAASTIEGLQSELLAFRLLVAALLVKAGGSALISDSDIKNVALNTELSAQPSAKGGTLWSARYVAFTPKRDA